MQKQRGSGCLAIGYTCTVIYIHCLNDATELVFSGSAVLKPISDEILKGPTLTVGEHAAALKEAITNYLERDFSWSSPFKLTVSRYKRFRRNLTTPLSQRTDNWERSYISSMIFFAVAHELGHIVSGHCDRRVPDNPEGRRELELQADSAAIQLFLKRAGIIKDNLRDDELKQLIQEFNRLVETGAIRNCTNFEEFFTSASLGAVATLFTIYELTERAAKALGKRWDDHYPSGKARYRAFRARSIELGVREPVFLDADNIHDILCSVAEDLAW